MRTQECVTVVLERMQEEGANGMYRGIQGEAHPFLQWL